jgi:hypothetical protein
MGRKVDWQLAVTVLPPIRCCLCFGLLLPCEDYSVYYFDVGEGVEGDWVRRMCRRRHHSLGDVVVAVQLLYWNGRFCCDCCYCGGVN